MLLMLRIYSISVARMFKGPAGELMPITLSLNLDIKWAVFFEKKKSPCLARCALRHNRGQPRAVIAVINLCPTEQLLYCILGLW